MLDISTLLLEEVVTSRLFTATSLIILEQTQNSTILQKCVFEHSSNK
jgi:hypothetical protein